MDNHRQEKDEEEEVAGRGSGSRRSKVNNNNRTKHKTEMCVMMSSDKCTIRSPFVRGESRGYDGVGGMVKGGGGLRGEFE